MAKATRKYTNMTIQLDLSVEEACVLSAILERIGGDISQSARTFTDNILITLRDIGINISLVDNYHILESNRAIYFNESSLDAIKEAARKYANSI